MSHPEQLGFFSAVASRNGALLRNARILEIGSYDVNGSVRKIFDGNREYIGVDLTEGPGVDLIEYGHKVGLPDSYFDLTVSGECFEHDPHWRETIANMVRMTRAGGMVAFSCASIGRPEHGTRRTDLAESPGTQSRGLDYYRNLSQSEIEKALPLPEWFTEYRFWYQPNHFDLYFAGVRSGEPAAESLNAQMPDEEDVAAIGRLMSLPHRLVRMPLRLAVRTLSEDRYQAVAVPYWQTLLRVSDRVASGRFRRAEH